MNTFDRIKNLAKARGVSISDVAKAVGLKDAVMYRWKSASPNSDSITKVADYFDVSVDYLLGRPDTKEMSDADLKAILDEPNGILNFDGKPVDDETKDMIIRILRGME
jgi:transcriptional regulator with XRE-family HTH domain